MDIVTFCRALPKIELHAHLNGSLSGNILKQLNCSVEDIDQFQKLTTDLVDNDNRLKECFTLFQIAHNATKTVNTVYLATKLVIDEFFNDNVIYLELRTTPREGQDMTKEEYIEAVVKGIKESDQKIQTKLILSIDRSHTLERSKTTFEIILKMKNKYPDIIKGLDFSGNPNVGCFNSDLFKLAREEGLFISLHCAEINEDQETENILNFNPERIGHGTFIDSGNWNLYKKKKIPLECCLTSNILCGTVKTYSDHHLSKWIKNNLPFCLCTDDKGIFATTLSKELFLATKYFKLTKKDLWKITYEAINFTFASENEKSQLRKQLELFKVKNSL